MRFLEIVLIEASQLKIYLFHPELRLERANQEGVKRKGGRLALQGGTSFICKPPKKYEDSFTITQDAQMRK